MGGSATLVPIIYSEGGNGDYLALRDPVNPSVAAVGVREQPEAELRHRQSAHLAGVLLRHGHKQSFLWGNR